MATSQLATSSFLSTRSVPTFHGLRPSSGLSSFSVSLSSSPKSFRGAVVAYATTVAASKSFNRLYLPSAPRASVTDVDSPTSTSIDDVDGKKLLLEVKDLTAVIAESGQKILNGVNLSVYEGEVHTIMGKNGSGKSTFAKVLVGHPDYKVTGGSVNFKGESLLDMEPEERSLAGLFLSFQSPVEIPGVSNADFLNMAYNARQRKRGLPELGPIEVVNTGIILEFGRSKPCELFGHLCSMVNLVGMNIDFLNRNVNEGFSGGERKRNEILQLAVLGAELAMLDEIDSGLDVDALQDVAKAVNGLLTQTNSLIMITHYQRLLEYIRPTYIHIMENGRIVKTGDISLAEVLEKEGFRGISDA